MTYLCFTFSFFFLIFWPHRKDLSSPTRGSNPHPLHWQHGLNLGTRKEVPYSSSIFFCIMVCYRVLNIVPLCYTVRPVCIHSVANSWHLLTPNSQSNPLPPPSSLATISLFSMSLTLLVFHIDRFICHILIPHVAFGEPLSELSRRLDGKESACQSRRCGRLGFHP